MDTRPPYQTDVSDEEWAFVAPYLTLLPEDVSQRKYPFARIPCVRCSTACATLSRAARIGG